MEQTRTQEVEGSNPFVSTTLTPLFPLSYPDTRKHPGPAQKDLGADRVQKTQPG